MTDVSEYIPPKIVKITIMLEELLALGHSGAEYDAYLINITEGGQFGSGFVDLNPNSKIPVLADHSTEQPTRVFESGAILLYLAEKFDDTLLTINTWLVMNILLRIWRFGHGTVV